MTVRTFCLASVCLVIIVTAASITAAAEVTEAEATANNYRRPASDVELRTWLENMVWFHQFENQDIHRALGLTPQEIEAAKKRLNITSSNRPAPKPNSPLLMLPYPGGRHPRIGFLDGALRPQRETKISVFTPWDPTSYVVIDVPEAIWSNLGLTYLAHTHIPTVWDKQNKQLDQLEWLKVPGAPEPGYGSHGGPLWMSRELPNGIQFGSQVRAHQDHIQMEMWLVNGSQKPLSDLRVQNCVMLRDAKEFAQQTNDNKIMRDPYVACRNEDGTRWIITAWTPLHRAWANAPCPCLHSDPKFPDCPPGETRRLRGWLSFYEGTDIDAELERIQETRWQQRPFMHRTNPANAGVIRAVEPDSLDKDYADQLPRLPPLEPPAALQSLRIIDGFEVQLAASEPLVTDPVAMAFDAHGRLYVVEMRGYSEQAADHLGRVRRLTDTNRDGQFDQATNFLEDLSWPTAVACYDGGVFVAVAPDLLYCKDTNNDGQCDQRTVVFTGFSRRNVQGLVNSLVWGLDGGLYGTSSSNGGQIKTIAQPDKKPINLARRDFVIDPSNMSLTSIPGGGQHGQSFDRWGHRYVSANSDHIQTFLFDERYATRNKFFSGPHLRRSIAADGPAATVYRTSPVEPWRIVRTRLRVKGMVGGPVEGGGRAAGYFTGATGVTIYQGDAFGQDFHDNTYAFVGDVGGNLVHRKRITDSGGNRVAHRADDRREFLTSDDTWFRPVQFANGPDGALYILDMYRETIEHPLSLPPMIKRHVDLTSGRNRGRIYRVIPTGFQRPIRLLPGDASSQQLVAMLGHKNGWHREAAQRLILEKPSTETVRLLRAQTRSTMSPDACIRGLRCLVSLDALDEVTLVAGLQHGHPQVRRHALQISEKTWASMPRVRQALIEMAPTEPEVRRQLALTLGEIPWRDRREPLLRLMRQASADDILQAAFFFGVANHQVEALSDLLSDEQFTSTPFAVATLAELARQIAAENHGAHIRSTFAAIDRHSNVSLRQHLTRMIYVNSKKRGDALLSWLKTARVPHAQDRIDRFLDESTSLALNPETALDLRIDSIKGLRIAEFDDVSDTLQQLIAARQLPLIQSQAIGALADYRGAQATDLILDAIPYLLPNERRRALDAICSQTDRIEPLLSEIASGNVRPSDLTASHRQQLLAHRSVEIRQRAAKLLGSTSDRDEVLAQYQSVLVMSGDARQGQQLFQKLCATCHQLDGNGKNVGPDLTPLRNRGASFMLTNILHPNREVDPRYESYVVETTDGRSLSGIVADQSGTVLRLRQAESEEANLQQAEIESVSATGKSLMPEGLEKDLNHTAMADLLAYLVQE